MSTMNQNTNAPGGIENYMRKNLQALADLINTASVATITSIDPDKSLLNLTIDTSKKELVEVPFMTLQGGGDFLQFPISVGDKCQIIYNKDSIEDWLGGEDDLIFSSNFDLNNGFAICGLNNQVSPITIKDYTDFKVFKGIKIRNENEELISLLSDGIQLLSDSSNLLATTTVTVTGGSSAGTYPLSSQAAFASLKTQVDALKVKLDSFKP